MIPKMFEIQVFTQLQVILGTERFFEAKKVLFATPEAVDRLMYEASEYWNRAVESGNERYLVEQAPSAVAIRLMERYYEVAGRRL